MSFDIIGRVGSDHWQIWINKTLSTGRRSINGPLNGAVGHFRLIKRIKHAWDLCTKSRVH